MHTQCYFPIKSTIPLFPKPFFKGLVKLTSPSHLPYLAKTLTAVYSNQPQGRCIQLGEYVFSFLEYHILQFINENINVQKRIINSETNPHNSASNLTNSSRF